jgi:hypothetical protein
MASSARSMSSTGAVIVVASRLVVPCFACRAGDHVRRVAAFHHVAPGAAVHVQVDEAGQDVVVAVGGGSAAWPSMARCRRRRRSSPRIQPSGVRILPFIGRSFIEGGWPGMSSIMRSAPAAESPCGRRRAPARAAARRAARAQAAAQGQRQARLRIERVGDAATSRPASSRMARATGVALGMLQHQRRQAGVGGLVGLAEPDLDRVAAAAAGVDDGVGEGARWRRPSSTCSMWPMARRPIQAPLASSPAGKPQPPTSRRLPSPAAPRRRCRCRSRRWRRAGRRGRPSGS